MISTERFVRGVHPTRAAWMRSVSVAALVAVSGCFATRNDVRVVQTDLASFRMEMLRNDSAQREALAQALRLVQVASDSISRISARTVGIQGDVRGEARQIREQLLQVQQLLGQSTSNLQRLRAEIEASARASTPPADPMAGAGTLGAAGAIPTRPDSSATGGVAPVTPTPAAPGPNELLVNGLDAIRRGSLATGRTALQQLLTTYPTFERADEAQYQIGYAYEREKQWAAADAAYGAVLSVYPNSTRASSALFKRGTIAQQQGNAQAARTFFEQVVARFPRSNEATLAADQLKTLK